jgi:ribosomal protein L37E
MGWFGGTLLTGGRREFGADDKVGCNRCGGQSYISRRTPHPVLGRGFELQTFTCRECGHEQTRSADQAGDVER